MKVKMKGYCLVKFFKSGTARSTSARAAASSIYHIDTVNQMKIKKGEEERRRTKEGFEWGKK